MARKEEVETADKASANGKTGKQGSSRERVVAALMRLLGTRDWQEITLSDICHEAHVTLAELRDLFPSKGAIVAGYIRQIDTQLLAQDHKPLADEPAKERLFDIVMRRFDLMTPDKAALRNIYAWTRYNPFALNGLNQALFNSMRFMLEAVDIDSEGPLGAAKLQGLILAGARVFSIWLEEVDPESPRTMAALDRELQRGEALLDRAQDVARMLSPLHGWVNSLFDSRARSQKHQSAEEHEAEVAAAPEHISPKPGK